MAEPPKKRVQIPVFSAEEDGTLTTPRIERFVLMIVDGVSPNKAWIATGGRGDGASRQYRMQVEAHPAFVGRLAALLKEKETFMAEGDIGEGKWMARQMWRDGRATSNASMMQKGADMWMKLIDKQGAQGAVDAPAGRPGKPSVENPQTHSGVDGLRQRLMAIGRPVPNGSQMAATGSPNGAQTAEPDYPIANLDDLQRPDLDFDAKLARMLPG